MAEVTRACAPDMSKFIAFLEARKAETVNPKHVAMLDVLIEHSIAEVRDRDIDRTMATLVDDRVYHHYGDLASLEASGMARVMRGKEVRENYLQSMERGILRMDSIECEPEHFFISDEAIAWDGFTHVRLPGAFLAGTGMPLPDGGTVEDDYVMTTRAVIVVPFRDGRMVGEDFYYDGERTIAKLRG